MMKKFRMSPHMQNNINSNQTLCQNDEGTGCSYLPLRLGNDKGIDMLKAMRDVLKQVRNDIDHSKKFSKVMANETFDKILQSTKRTHNRLALASGSGETKKGYQEIDLGNGIKKAKF